jgi:hypothetical protein
MTLRQEVVQSLEREYAAVGESIGSTMHASDAVISGSLTLVATAATFAFANTIYRPLLAAPLAVGLLAAHGLRNMAEFHAKGGYRRAIERALDVFNQGSPLIWETLVHEHKFRRLANTRLLPFLYLVIYSLSCAAALIAASKENLSTTATLLVALYSLALLIVLARTFWKAAKLGETFYKIALPRLCRLAQPEGCDLTPTAPVSATPDTTCQSCDIGMKLGLTRA